MQELTVNKTSPANTTEPQRSVTFYIEGQLTIAEGAWSWPLHCEAVFCSDVMMAWPADFTGAKGIVHPTDKAAVTTALDQFRQGDASNLQFNIITTYGEVKLLSGTNLCLKATEEGAEETALPGLLQQTEQAYGWLKEAVQAGLQKTAYNFAERINEAGVWYLNTASGQTWYSDQVYRIYGFPPQALNAHPNTFHPYIHPDDRNEVVTALEEAFARQNPLQLQFRIVHLSGQVRWVHQATNWAFTDGGAYLLHAVLKDITAEKEVERRCDDDEAAISFQKQLLHFAETATNIGYWQINVVTKKVVYSDNHYRLFGLKPGGVVATPSTFTNYVYPDDRPVYEEVQRKMRKEHVAPEIDFRIVRADGKTRYLRQKGKAIITGAEVMLVGTIQDITVQKNLEKKLAEAKEKEQVTSFVVQQTEAMADAGRWLWNVTTGEAVWSDTFSGLLGFKQGSIRVSQKLFLRHVHPDDQRHFSEEMALTLHERQAADFTFRLIAMGEVRFMKAALRLMPCNGAEYFICTIQNISAAHNAHRELKERIRLVETISNTISAQLIITDTENNITLLNAEGEKALNVRRDKAVGQNFFDVFPALKTETVLERFSKALSGNEVVALNEKAAFVLQGYYNIRHVPLTGDNGEVTGLIHLIQNVTPEHNLAQQLGNRIRFIEKLLEAAADRIVVLDRNLNYLYWNKRAEEQYGFSKEQAIGKNILELFPDAAGQSSYPQIRQALRGQVVHLPMESNHNGTAFFETYFTPITNENGEVEAVLWVVHDLTNEFILTREQKKAQQILDGIHEACFELDEDNCITYVNHKAALYWGMTKEELLAQPVWQLFPGLVDSPIYFAVEYAQHERTAVQKEFLSPVSGRWLNLTIAPSGDGVIVLFYDVHETIEARRALEEEHRCLNEAQALGKLGSFEWKVGEEYTAWSDEMYRINGMEPQSGLIKTDEVHQMIHPEDYSRFNRLMKASLKTPGSYELEHRIILANGTIKDVAHRFESIAGNDGRVVRVHGTVQDITKHKKAEEEINKNISILRQSEDIAAIGSWEYQIPSGRFSWSDGMYRIFDYPRGAPVQPEVYVKEATPDCRTAARRIAKNIREGRQAFEETMRIKRADGERLLKVKGAVEFDETGQPFKVIGVDLDITDVKAAEERLKAQDRFAQTIFDASIDQMTVFDSDYRFVAWNRRCEEIGGLLREDVLGKSIYDVFPCLRNDAEFVAAQEKAMAGEYVYIPAKRGVYSTAFHEWFYVPLKNAKGETYSVLNIIHDISEKVAAEEQLKHTNRELEEKNEEISRFAFISSHDLKELIRKLHTFSNWLIEKEADDLSIRGKEMVVKMADAVQRLDQLVTDITALTRLDAVKEKPEQVDLSDVLREAITELAPEIETASAQIDAASLPVVQGNPKQLVLLFKNILGNAIKFQEADVVPVVEIRCQQVANPDGLPPGQYVVVSFTDNGIGFEPEYVDRIFKVFQRLHGQSAYPGTGIGLAICKKIMENHGGVIQSKSELRQGATFSCFFPAAGSKNG